MSLGLPSFSMIFSGKAVSAIERSARGIVCHDSHGRYRRWKRLEYLQEGG